MQTLKRCPCLSPWARHSRQSQFSCSCSICILHVVKRACIDFWRLKKAMSTCWTGPSSLQWQLNYVWLQSYYCVSHVSQNAQGVCLIYISDSQPGLPEGVLLCLTEGTWKDCRIAELFWKKQSLCFIKKVLPHIEVSIKIDVVFVAVKNVWVVVSSELAEVIIQLNVVDKCK